MNAALNKFHSQHSVCFQPKDTRQVEESSETDIFCHFVERAKNGDVNILHVAGCEVTPENKDAQCPLMTFLKKTHMEIDEFMPRVGDYECTREDETYLFTPFAKTKNGTIKP